MPNKERIAVDALKFIIPLIEKRNFHWLITGGFASYVYGVKRDLTDIDIDIATEARTPAFKDFLKEIKPHITQNLEHYVDQNYDNYNFEITYNSQMIDICPSQNLKIFNETSNQYELFYKERFPRPEMKNFHDLQLPLLPKKLIIKNKEMLIWKRETDIEDIKGLKNL